MQSPKVSGFRGEYNPGIREYYDALNQWLTNYSARISGAHSRKDFLLITIDFKNASIRGLNIPITFDNIDELINYFRQVENESGVSDKLEKLKINWQEENIERRKRGGSFGSTSSIKAIESQFLGGVKGKGIELKVKKLLLSLNKDLEGIKFIEAPLIDDFIDAADVYMAIKIKNDEEQLVIFTIDITGAIKKEIQVKKLSKEMNNYPISLYFYNPQADLDIYRIEFALNQIRFAIDELKEVFSIYAPNLAFYLDRFRRDPRYKDGFDLESLNNFLDSYLSNNLQIKNKIEAYFYLMSLKNIIETTLDDNDKNYKSIIGVLNQNLIRLKGVDLGYAA